MQFPSGMVGVSIVLFAIMGTIGVGYLLNGNTTYETVDGYDYVTDVTGLYNYTPVAAYAPYSPAANNYQYSTVKANLGTYTSGISYTEAGAANLNPIITPSSGTTVTTGTISYADLPGDEITARAVIVRQINPATNGIEAYVAPELNAKLIPLRSLVDQIGDYTTISIPFPNLNANLSYTQDGTAYTDSYTFQPVGIYYATNATTYDDAINAAKDHYATASGQNNYLTSSINSDISIDLPAGATQIRPHETKLVSNPVGVISSLTINPNGTATYTYTYNDVPTQRTVNIDATTLIVFSNNYTSGSSTIDYTDTYTPQITYTKTIIVDIEYMDPNYGVSTTADTVYWSNGNDIGSVQWLIKRPSATTAQTFTAYHADNTAASTFTVNYDTWWTLSYNGANINMGKAWDGVLITAYYTGELQWSPVRFFTNFTEYRIGNTTTIEASAPMNAAISYYTITKAAGAPSFNFAVVGTSVASGNVPGAMFNASFNIANYFPQYDDVRVSFDSAAYVGTEVKVGTWTMDVDSGSFVGEFTIGSETYRVDLTKPWSINWTSADTVSITYTPYNKMGTQTVTILNQDAAKVVNLSGQWVIDTDLYEITSKEEPVYNWNFGHWGLAKVPFIVCVIGLIALLSIAYRITGVSFHGLDYAVIALASLIIWVIL